MTEPMSKAEKIQHEFVPCACGAPMCVPEECSVVTANHPLWGKNWCGQPREAHINSQEKQDASR